ncbi:YgjV family protein [Azospirillum halopraeferens]|uniref:YgjV family protein n=1 Tax=Azospirillum halopraeferens TaxID=34010 RepID=UPI000423D208|nr:YgjV family protein [Azospirillum halopraeferens]
MIDAFLAAPVAQGIGLLGTACGMAWPAFRTRTGILLAQLATNLFFTVHLLMLGAATGALMNGLSAVQVAAAIPLGTRPGFRLVYLAVLPVIAAASALTWQGLPSLFAALGMALVSLSRYQTDVWRLRLIMMVAFPCWFAHNLLVGSLPGMMSDVAGMALNTVMMLRLARARRPVAGVA